MPYSTHRFQLGFLIRCFPHRLRKITSIIGASRLHRKKRAHIETLPQRRSTFLILEIYRRLPLCLLFLHVMLGPDIIDLAAKSLITFFMVTSWWAVATKVRINWILVRAVGSFQEIHHLRKTDGRRTPKVLIVKWACLRLDRPPRIMARTSSRISLIGQVL